MPESDTINAEKQSAASPQPVAWTRNEAGLLGFVNYEKNTDGSINWRKMIKPEFLVINKANFERRQAKVPDSIEGVEDKDLLILLGGIKDLAKLRGYTAVTHTPIIATPSYFAVKTTICWTPNFETNNQAVCFDALADASNQNTQSFARLYLAAIAENRGFVRAVRNFLGINIVGQDEIGAPPEEPTNSAGNSVKFLEGILKRNNIKFESFKNQMIKSEAKGADDWESISDVPEDQAFELADIVQKLLEAKAAAKAKAKQ